MARAPVYVTESLYRLAAFGVSRGFTVTPLCAENSWRGWMGVGGAIPMDHPDTLAACVR